VKQGQLNFMANLLIWEHDFLLFTFDDGTLDPSLHLSCFSRIKLRNLSEQILQIFIY
jgi:hypothetical protein